MALFARRPQVAGPQLYMSQFNKTLLIVGLGNPGAEYDGTRHNIGFEAIDAFAQAFDLPDFVAKKNLKCVETQGRIGDAQVILIKPQTFMNLSGESVQAVSHFYKIPAEQIIVVHDELDIDFGNIRTRVGGSAAGHNGIKSIIASLDTENFARVRIGVGPKHPARITTDKFVLQKFDTAETEQIKNCLKETTAILSEAIYAGGKIATETRSFII